MTQLVVNLFLGMVPEVIFFCVFLTTCKEIKNKFLSLFILNILSYIGAGILTSYSIFSYILYIFAQYVILKLLYKDKIEYIDVFLITISHVYVFIIGLVCYKLVNNYYVAFILDRILLFVPFIFSKKLKNIYQLYKKAWNRNKENKIRSISLRNISLIILNVFLFLSDLVCTYISIL